MEHPFLTNRISPGPRHQLHWQRMQRRRRAAFCPASSITTLLVATATALMCLSSVGVRPVLASSSGVVVTTDATEEVSAAGAEVTTTTSGGHAIVAAAEVVPVSRRSLATGCTSYDGYIAYRDIDRDGDDIGNYGSAFSALTACNRNPSCIAFNSQGWAKRSATPAMPYDGLCLWVKRSSVAVSSGACAGGQPAQPTQVYFGSARQALTDLVQDYCFSNSGAKCDGIDFMGDSDWYREYFYAFPPLSNSTCNTELVLATASEAPKAASRNILTCRPNPTSEGVCTFAPRLETASSVTVTQGTGYNDQFKAGVVTKIKASFGTMETTMESTFDFGFSSTASASTARVIGQSTGAAGSVTTSPGDTFCTSLTVSLGRQAAVGKLEVYLEFSGGVGTRQNDWRAWKNINNGRTDFKYLYHPLWYIVSVAKAAGIARASAFTVVGTTVRATTPVTLSMQLPIYGYVNPQRHDLNSVICSSASARTSDPAPDEGAKPSPSRSSPPPSLRSSPPPSPRLSRPPPSPRLSRPPPSPRLSRPPPSPRLSRPPPSLRSSPPPSPRRPPPRRPPPRLSTIRSRMAAADPAIDAVAASAAATFGKSSAAAVTTTTTAPQMLDESSVNIAARTAQQQTSSSSSSGVQMATKLDTRSASLSSFEGTISPVFMQRLKALMSAYCRAQSGGDDCEVDWDGDTDWWRTFFLSLQPAQVATGLDAPVWNKTASGLDNVTSGLVVCPYRPFNYRCQIDAHSYQSTVVTRSRTSTQNYGVTNKVQVLFGADLSSWGLTGIQSGFTFSASSSFSWSDGTAVASTETATAVQSYSVQMNPATNTAQKCAHLMTRMAVARVRGIQSAWLAIDGYVGFHHDDSRVWKSWSDSKPHYYRAQTFSSVIDRAKSFGLKEADEWTTGRIEVPVEVVVMTGVMGSTGAVYYDAGSQQCNLPEPA